MLMIHNFHKNAKKYACDVNHVGPLKYWLPKNDTLERIQFSSGDETWILGNCWPITKEIVIIQLKMGFKWA